MILKSFKEKAIDKIIQRELQGQKGGAGTGVEPINSLAVIINYDRLADFKPLLGLAADLSVAGEQVYILGYVEKIHKSVNYLIPVFSETSVKTNGLVKATEVQEFLGRRYDLLVNYYEDTHAVMKLMSVLTKASFKVGISEEMSAFNDLTVLTDATDFNGFRSELVKYLNILRKK